MSVGEFSPTFLCVFNYMLIFSTWIRIFFFHGRFSRCLGIFCTLLAKFYHRSLILQVPKGFLKLVVEFRSAHGFVYHIWGNPEVLSKISTINGWIYKYSSKSYHWQENLEVPRVPFFHVQYNYMVKWLAHQSVGCVIF